MNEEVDDQDFYQHNFTTTTYLEIFIAHLEKIIQEWRLPKVKIEPRLKKGEFSEGEWERTSKKNIICRCVVMGNDFIVRVKACCSIVT